VSAVLTPEDARRAAADRVKAMPDVHLPVLASWNRHGICRAHAEAGAGVPVLACPYQACGGDLFSYQRVGVAWLYLRGSGLLADDTGLGKTVMALGLACLLAQRAELKRRALFVVATASIAQWVREAARWAPGLAVAHVSGRQTKQSRAGTYASAGWEVLLVGSHLALRDRAVLQALGPFDLVFVDDVDELLNPRNATHRAIVALANRSARAVVANATTLQTKVDQVIAASFACGGQAVFGTMTQAMNRYVKRDTQRIRVRGGAFRHVSVVTGYQHLDELRDRLEPMYLRRRVEDLSGVDVPELLPPAQVWLELSAAQSALYDALKRGALKLTKADGTTFAAATNLFQSGQRICAGLMALGKPDGPGASPKLDWLMAKLSSEWSERKVVVYVVNRAMVAATAARCDGAGIGRAQIWGGQSAEQRGREVERFQTDPGCRVAIVNKAGERALNLQAASVLVALDTVLNPARMKQLLGRIRRAGSAHGHVQMVTLLHTGTQEERYAEVLRRRAALSDFVFGEESGAEMFGHLSTYELLELITG
jgi:hypothetical protein